MTGVPGSGRVRVRYGISCTGLVATVYEYREWHWPQISALARLAIGAMCAVSFGSTPSTAREPATLAP